jgi:phenylacetate-CoA ligase
MRVVHCLNYAGWTGGYTDHQSLEKAGACVLPWGVGNTEQLISMILDLGIEAISCTPSYLSVVKSVLKEKFGMIPKQLGLSIGLFGGEAGLQNKSFRDKIENEWHIDAIDANYGMADVMSIFASENRMTKDGLIFLANGYLHPEISEKNGYAPKQIEKGMVGELVLSTLYTGGLIKRKNYNTGDIIEVLEGGVNFKFKVIGRSDEMIVVKGINIYPSAIAEIMNSSMLEFDDDFLWQAWVSKEDPIEKFIIAVQSDMELQKSQIAYIKERLKSKIGLNINIESENIISQNAKVKQIVRCL